MPETTEMQGHCLCEAVKINASNASKHVGACHCGTCRRWCGGPALEVDCGADVVIEGSENVVLYDSSEWAERGFCRSCGTHLFYRLKETQQHLVPVGIFAGDEKLVFDHQVFIDEKPDFYRFANDTKDMTGAEVFAMYGSSE